MVCFRGGMAVGGLAAGAPAHWWNVPATFGLAGFALAAVGLWGAFDQHAWHRIGMDNRGDAENENL